MFLYYSVFMEKIIVEWVFNIIVFSILLFLSIPALFYFLDKVSQLTKQCMPIVATVVTAHLVIVEDRNSIIKVATYFYYFLLGQYIYIYIYI